MDSTYLDLSPINFPALSQKAFLLHFLQSTFSNQFSQSGLGHGGAGGLDLGTFGISHRLPPAPGRTARAAPGTPGPGRADHAHVPRAARRAGLLGGGWEGVGPEMEKTQILRGI